MKDTMIEKIKKEMWDLCLPKIKKVGKSNEEAEEILDKKIWLKTLCRCSKPVTPVELRGLCERICDDWCEEHKKPKTEQNQ